MIDPPGGLFPNDFNYGLPFIKGINLRFVEIFIYVAFYKALQQKNKFQSVFKRSYQLLLVLTIILLIYTLLLDSLNLSFIITIKWIFTWSLIFIIPKLVNTYDEWIFLFRIAFIIVFIAFLSQIFQLALGYSPSVLLGTDFNPMMDYGNVDFVLSKMNISEYDLIEARPISCSYIILLALVGAMFFQQSKRKYFSQNYLYLVIIISYISILLTATRGWFIAFSVVLILYFAFRQNIKRVITISILIVILIPLLLLIPYVQKQLLGAFNRLETIESLAHGDLSAGGTNARNDYSIELINLWKQSPILGWGFSDIYKVNKNGHAGLANLLFGVGILGYLVFIYFWYVLFFTPLKVNRMISSRNPFKGSLVIFSLAFLLFFILHSTSGQQFGIYLGIDGGVFSQVLFYCYSSFFIIEAMNLESEIKHIVNE